MRGKKLEVGSMVTFIIVGAILALVLFAAVWGIRQRGEQARRDAEIAQQEEVDNGDRAPAPPSETDEQLPRDNDEAGETGAGGVAPDGPAGPSELPATGLTSLAPLAFLGLIAYAGVLYVRSARERARAFDF